TAVSSESYLLTGMANICFPVSSMEMIGWMAGAGSWCLLGETTRRTCRIHGRRRVHWAVPMRHDLVLTGDLTYSGSNGLVWLEENVGQFLSICNVLMRLIWVIETKTGAVLS